MSSRYSRFRSLLPPVGELRTSERRALFVRLSGVVSSSSGVTRPLDFDEVLVERRLRAAATIGPRIRTCVSRQCSLSCALPIHWSATPTPPVNADLAVDDEDLAVGAVVQFSSEYHVGRVELAHARSRPLAAARRAPRPSTLPPTASTTRLTAHAAARRRLERAR